MEGTGVVSLATVVRHNGLVDGAMPWNRLLCLTLDEPWHSFACGCVLPVVRPGGFGQGALQDITFGWCGGGASGAVRLTGLGVGLARARAWGAMTWGSASADRSIIGIGWLVTVSAVTVNGMRATAAAMRYGFRRGEIFGGCEPRCGEHAITTCAPHLRVVGVGCVDCETQRTPDRLRGAINSRLHVWSKPSEW